MITPSFSLTATERVLPKLALDFTTASLDPRVTFTRTTDATHPATYIASTGYITAATDNQPRFDYDPVTLACKGLLIEESRSNLVAASQQAFNNTTYWTKTGGVTVSDSSVSSPEGSNTASVATGVNGVTNYLTSAQITISASANYAFSMFIKAGTSVSSRVRIYNGALSAEFAGVVILWTAGVPSTSSTSGTWVTAPTYTSFGNGWYRVTGVFGSGAQTNAKILIYPDQNGSGATTQIYGAQLEAGAFTTSYIPTTTTALTRNADVATMTGTNFSDWYNASEGTFEFQGEVKALVAGARFLGVSDGTSTNRMEFLNNLADGKLRWYSSGGVASDTVNAMSANVVFGASGAYKLNDYATALNGGATVADTSATVPAVNQMRIGYSTTTGSLNGWMRKIMYFPQRLINAEVQSFSKV